MGKLNNECRRFQTLFLVHRLKKNRQQEYKCHER